jgi:hypothetical protein
LVVSKDRIEHSGEDDDPGRSVAPKAIRKCILLARFNDQEGERWALYRRRGGDALGDEDRMMRTEVREIVEGSFLGVCSAEEMMV